MKIHDHALILKQDKTKRKRWYCDSLTLKSKCERKQTEMQTEYREYKRYGCFESNCNFCICDRCAFKNRITYGCTFIFLKKFRFYFAFFNIFKLFF